MLLEKGAEDDRHRYRNPGQEDLRSEIDGGKGHAGTLAMSERRDAVITNFSRIIMSRLQDQVGGIGMQR